MAGWSQRDTVVHSGPWLTLIWECEHACFMAAMAAVGNRGGGSGNSLGADRIATPHKAAANQRSGKDESAEPAGWRSCSHRGLRGLLRALSGSGAGATGVRGEFDDGYSAAGWELPEAF